MSPQPHSQDPQGSKVDHAERPNSGLTNSKFKNIRPACKDFPISVCGDFVNDELAPADANIRLSTKDPALVNHRSERDQYIQQIAGGAWHQFRMLQSIHRAWNRWRKDLHSNILERHFDEQRKNLPSGSQPTHGPPMALCDHDFTGLQRLLYPALYAGETENVDLPYRFAPHITCTKPHPASRRDAITAPHTYHWLLERKPKSSPIDDKNQIYRATGLTPRRAPELRPSSDLGLSDPTVETGASAESESPMLHLVGDYNLDFRYQPLWDAAENNSWRDTFCKPSATGLPCRIILFGSALPGSGEREFLENQTGRDEFKTGKDKFWEYLKSPAHQKQGELFKDTIAIAGIDLFRLAGADLAFDQSWDRILEDYNRELIQSESLREMCRFEHLIIRIGVTGAIYHHNPKPGEIDQDYGQHQTLLIYDPSAPKIWYRSPDAQGNVLGTRSAFATCIAARIQQGWFDHQFWRRESGGNDAYPKLFNSDDKNNAATRQIMLRGIKDAICFSQELYAAGYGDDAGKVREALEPECLENAYFKSVLCGNCLGLEALRVADAHAWNNVTKRRLPQRSRCIAHVHAPVDDSSFEWGITRNMLRMGIPEHLDRERAHGLMKNGKATQTNGNVDFCDHERRRLEKRIAVYVEQRRLNLAMKIITDGPATVLNRNTAHYTYQLLLERLPGGLKLSYTGNKADKENWIEHARVLNEAWLLSRHTRLECLLKAEDAMTVKTGIEPGAQKDRIQSLLTAFASIDTAVSLLQGSPLMPHDNAPLHSKEEEPELAGLDLTHSPRNLDPDDLFFFPLENRHADEWDFPQYLALEIWAQRSCQKMAEDAKNSNLAAAFAERSTLLENLLRLLIWIYPCQAPVGDFGGFIAIDQNNVESFSNIRNLIINHVRIRAGKPLNIGVFGGPGSGKSFGVRAIARELGEKVVETEEFNMAHFQGKEDLDRAFLKVSSILAQGKTPLVFFDEFDCIGPAAGGDFQWLSYFLEPMQDGRYQHSGGTLSLGNSIFVFAGGRHASYQEFQARVLAYHDSAEAKEARQRKFPDFISRIRGYVNVAGLNSQTLDAHFPTEERAIPYLQRALMVRSYLERSGWCEQDSRGVKGRAKIMPDVAEAFLTVSRFHHGKRSVENLLSMCVPIKQMVIKASFPTTHQLDMHTWGNEFRERMQLPGCAWVTPYMYIPPKDLSVSAGSVYPSWQEVTDWELLGVSEHLELNQADVWGFLLDFAVRVCSDESRIRMRDGHIESAERAHIRALLNSLQMAERANNPSSESNPPAAVEETGPWKKPWEAYFRDASLDAGAKEEWRKRLWAEGIEDKCKWVGTTNSPIIPQGPKDEEFVIPLVMLEQLRPVCLRLYYKKGRGLCLTSDSTRLAAGDLVDGSGDSRPTGLWTESWAWDRKDKGRILKNIVKNLYMALHGPESWREFKKRKSAEWRAKNGVPDSEQIKL